MAVGRSVETVAELCFMAQCALILREAARGAGVRPVVLASYLIVPLIAFAETNSWYAVLTTNCLGNVIEESTWLEIDRCTLLIFSADSPLPSGRGLLRSRLLG